MFQTRTILPVLLITSLVAPLAFAWHDGPGHGQEPVQPDWKRMPAPETPLIVGEGEHTFQWDAHWMQLPEGRDWLGSTHGCIALDRKGRLYMSAETGPAILVYGEDGVLQESFGQDWGGGVHGLSVVTHKKVDKSNGVVDTSTWKAEDPRWQDHGQTLWIAHTSRNLVMHLTLKGEVLRSIGWPQASGKYESKDQYKPTSVAVGPGGQLFIADGYGKSWVHIYSADGEYQTSFGGPGDEPKNLSTPHGLWMDYSTKPATLLVADRENHRLARFDLQGEFLSGTDPESGLLRRPCHVQFRGDLGVVADLAGRVTLLDSDLKLVAHLGDNPKTGERANYNVAPQDWREGVFCAPHCAGFDQSGNLYVMDWNVAGRVTRLSAMEAK